MSLQCVANANSANVDNGPVHEKLMSHSDEMLAAIDLKKK